MRFGILAAVLLALTGLQANAQELKTEDEKTIYALGLSIGRSVKVFDLTPAEIEIVKRGMTDSLTGAKPVVDLEKYGPNLQPLAKGRQERAGQKFLETAAKEKGATKLPSGIIYKELKAGTGASPKATDTVKVNYRGTLITGTEFDSSYKRGEPAEFPLNGVIPCWTEGVQKMKVGGKSQLVCPAKVAYGDQGSPPSIPPNATLVFEIELLGIGGQGADVPRADPQPKK
ncbi:FKBP-type peptidyl-prolyl cis-trans isomerase FkpA [Archangium gephyra]|uniref:Peptidyl-prolyl cis-trans isomerase n=1 Tax=Archangium gephyra TaxID=48 RepID=A0AAC8TF05_9BACT|nr:FKBP-type peptidyl-prolyl cis-trans isomerase [Archangium gephyra]AKJ03512.1 FKBP-type peptidyl-prolyl cis-trans isomerase FkpA precursor [Archangium gephyra]REG23989.1 FKBP-type peptidyl-prolyl cis-trans isomerase FkpA [Archangium gephyra]